MWEWFKSQNTYVKTMLVIALVCVVGIVFRWSFIKQEVAGDFDRRFGVECLPAHGNDGHADSLPNR